MFFVVDKKLSEKLPVSKNAMTFKKRSSAPREILSESTKKIKVKSVKSSSLSDLPIFTDNMKCLCFDDNASIGAKM